MNSFSRSSWFIFKKPEMWLVVTLQSNTLNSTSPSFVSTTESVPVTNRRETPPNTKNTNPKLHYVAAELCCVQFSVFVAATVRSADVHPDVSAALTTSPLCTDLTLQSLVSSECGSSRTFSLLSKVLRILTKNRTYRFGTQREPDVRKTGMEQEPWWHRCHNWTKKSKMEQTPTRKWQKFT